MSQLPPEDQPDVFSIGPVGSIPIIEDDDPRYTGERAAWSGARAKAQALHSADELLAGVQDEDWRVRHESIDRLVVRWPGDARTLPAILELAESDSAWQVRDEAMWTFTRFEPERVVPVAQRVFEHDPNADVRWSASFVLFQIGVTDSLAEMPD